MKVLYVDDEQKALDEFLRWHAVDGISVEGLQDVRKLKEALESRAKKDLPDLIVTDLYRTRGALATEAASRINAQVDALVLEIAASRKKLEALVALEKEPAAIEALASIRSSAKLQHIPVIICTREGLSLIDDGLLRLSLKLGADWMIKGRSPEVIRELMVRNYREAIASRKRIARDVVLMWAGSLIGTLLGYLVSRWT